MSEHKIPDDLSIPEFLRRPVTPQTKAAVTRVINETRRGVKLAPEDDRITISTGYAANLEPPGLEMLREIIKRTKPETVEHERAKRALRYGERKMKAKAGTKEMSLREVREAQSKPIKGTLTAMLTDKPIDLTKQTKVKVEGNHVTVVLPPEPVVAAAIEASKSNGKSKKAASKKASKKSDTTDISWSEMVGDDLRKAPPNTPIETAGTKAFGRAMAKMAKEKSAKKASVKAAKPAKPEKAKKSVEAKKPGKLQIVEDMLVTERGATRDEILAKLVKTFGPSWKPWKFVDLELQLERYRKRMPKAKLVGPDAKDRWRMVA